MINSIQGQEKFENKAQMFYQALLNTYEDADKDEKIIPSEEIAAMMMGIFLFTNAVTPDIDRDFSGL